MFNPLNQLNLSLQGKDANILLSQNKITFIKKLNIWKARISDNVVDMFPVLCDYTANKPLSDKELIFSDIQPWNCFLNIIRSTF